MFGGWVLSSFNGHLLFFVIGAVVASSMWFYHYGNARYEGQLQKQAISA
jgi:arginine exporter protein ArgO